MGTQNSSLLQGATCPDALKKVDSVFHNLHFASYMLEFALTSAGAGFSDGTFDSFEFSLGFNIHLAADAVAHHSGTFLVDSNNHEMEYDVDTWQMYGTTAPPNFSFSFLDLSVAPRFLLAAADYYTAHCAASDPQFSGIYAEDALSAAFTDANVQNGVEKLSLIGSKFVYKKDLIRLDPCGSDGWDETQNHAQVSITGSELACSSLLNPSLYYYPDRLYSTVMDTVSDFYLRYPTCCVA
jgi:hypothetical protein